MCCFIWVESKNDSKLSLYVIIIFAVGKDFDIARGTPYIIGILIWILCGLAWLSPIINSLQEATEDKLPDTVGQMHYQTNL